MGWALAMASLMCVYVCVVECKEKGVVSGRDQYMFINTPPDQLPRSTHRPHRHALHGGGAREDRGQRRVGQGGRDGVDAHGGGQLRGE
jgi:hypothetical protein